MKNIDVILLAAGYGTRLYPLTENKPKALLEVGGKTILARLLEKITALGRCKNIFIVTNDKFYKSFEDWRAAGNSFVNIEVINDGTLSNETRLGAIGDIGLVLGKKDIRNDLLIMGSDNLFDMDLADFIKFSSERRPGSALLLFDVGDKEKAKRYGICALDDENRVIHFDEKPPAPKSTLAATAVYFIPKEKIFKVSEYMKTNLPKDAPGNLISWLAGEDIVYGFVLKKSWFDIGDIESLKKADEEFKRKEKK